MLARADDHVDAHVADRLDEGAQHALRRGAVEVAAELEEHAARRIPLSPPDVQLIDTVMSQFAAEPTITPRARNS
jgi:hypothetical protein